MSTTRAVVVSVWVCAACSGSDPHEQVLGDADVPGVDAPDADSQIDPSPDTDDARDASSDEDEIDAPTPPPTLIEPRSATAFGLEAFAVNARIQPRGRPTTVWFEVGTTSAYGASTPAEPLPARLGAHYHESWDAADAALAGWLGGYGHALSHVAEGGSPGGFVRYAMPDNLDSAHADGIGANMLAQYFFPGEWQLAANFAALGGGDPDFRGANIAVSVRGNDFVAKTSELVFWLQSTSDLAATYDPTTERWSNWACNDAVLTDGLLSGAWERVAYALHADSNAWTYAGHYVASGRDTYVYVPLGQVLSHLNGDMFHMLTFFEYGAAPEGTIDFDELDITYSQRSLIAPQNGGRLVSAPDGGDDPARLTDGWRNGPERGWASGALLEDMGAPLELRYALAAPAELDVIEVHQSPEHPSTKLELLASTDGVEWRLLASPELPISTSAGANFAYSLTHVSDATPFQYVAVRITDGVGERWGLGEIEVFGRGVALPTEDDWVGVTADVGADVIAITPGTTYHYRVVAESNAGRFYGDDQTYTVPLTRAPVVGLPVVSRLRGGTAHVSGRVTPLGLATNYDFELGTDETYGQHGGPKYAGLEPTPRSVTDTLVDLVPGTTYHLRLTAENADGRVVSPDVTFVAE